ncbi:arsenate reductase (glutaredoxin) [Reichenbachiella agarivorans]|uniref:Arsenate reductase (Glutaredoxin) n=1 Tax=Reichenbachiella agarivorans TaxID=2979464 RepID=A0ABY6CQB2_9BACT|nr:arsenate reductase (glutaredoxin) [Reichenbachiella agarivorans]UXP32554.1 arsenate reductase (glutaredoxin) [Reichenbachiella agarivorans]
MTKIYHNPRCGKSRNALTLLQEKDEDLDIIEYLKTPLTENELTTLIQQLGISAESLVRKGENIYKEQYKGKNLSENQWVEAMVQNPILIERPIVVKNGRAVIGRPPENVLEIL